MILHCEHWISGLEKWMDGSAADASSGKTQEFIRHNPHNALWVFSSHWAYIGCTLVIAVHYEIEWVHLITSW